MRPPRPLKNDLSLQFPQMASTALSPSLHLPPKPLHHLVGSSHRIPVCGFGTRRSGVGRLRVSDQRDMTELPRADAFGGRRSEAVAVAGIEKVVAGIEKVRVGRRWGDVEAVLNRMSKWLVAGLFGFAILWRHDAETLWAAMGSVVNTVISTTLKHMLNHQRPDSALRSDPGMPSSHAQSIFYAAAYAVLSLFHWLGSDAFTVTVGTLILMSASYLSWLRVSQKLHTINQILVGSVLGAACGITWHWLWLSFVKAAFATSVWARLIVVLGSTSFCVAFVLHVIKHWLTDEQ